MLKKTLYKACVMAFMFLLIFPISTRADELTRQVLLNTLDNLQLILDENPFVPPGFQVQIDIERKRVLSATADELENMPEGLKNKYKILERNISAR